MNNDLKQSSNKDHDRSLIHLLTKNNLLPILTGIFFTNFISRIIISPMMPAIEADLGISHTAAGSFFFTISIGYFISLIGSGYISSFMTHRKTIILSSFTLGFALFLCAASEGLLWMQLGLIILGLSTGLYLPSGISTLTAAVHSKVWGKAISVHELAPNLAFILAPVIAEVLMIWLSWRMVLTVTGFTAIAVSLIFVRFGKGGEFTGVTPGIESVKKLVTKPIFWMMVILFGMGVSGTLGTFAVLPLYLVSERGIDRNTANMLLSLSRLSGPVMAFAGGWAVDRFGVKNTLCCVFTLTGLFTILMGIVQGSWISIIIFIQPLSAVCFFPAGFVALSSITSKENRNIAVSLAVPLGFVIGGGLVPTVVGMMGDAGSFAYGLVLTGSFILLGGGISLFLKIPEHAVMDHVKKDT